TVAPEVVTWPAAGGRTGHGCCNPAPGFLGIIHTAAAAAITEEGTDADRAGVHALSVRSATELRRDRTRGLRAGGRAGGPRARRDALRHGRLHDSRGVALDLSHPRVAAGHLHRAEP